MVDLAITATSVVSTTDRNLENGRAGETITAGKAVYKAAATNRYMLADSNSAVAEARVPTGIALNGGNIGQTITVQKSGDITIGATLVSGTDYWLSDTPGGICPRADVTTGEYPCLIGIAKSTTVLTIGISTPGVVI